MEVELTMMMAWYPLWSNVMSRVRSPQIIPTLKILLLYLIL